ncbi:MAG TPA: response regulator [Gemmatimonadaceae bacterium]|nr:response regulator [Gemmatimonadaceae bacterium]
MNRQCHVLVADDEPHIGRIIQMKLEQGPFRVTLAYDGQEAVELLEGEDKFDLALLDLMMPRLNGLGVLKKVRDDDRLKGLPCIILTAGGDAKHERDALELGATHFLTKPFSPKKLYALVAKLTGVGEETGE